MSKRIENIHTEMIRLFVKIEGIEKQVDIPTGHSKIVDDHTTPTMRIFQKKGYIKIEDAQLYESNSFHLLNDRGEEIDTVDEYKTIDDSIDSNNDEAMDHAHTTESYETEDELEEFKKNLMKSLTLQEAPTRLEVVEGEVEQYIEGGFVKGEWTEEDIEFLKKNYPTKGRKYCSVQLNRNESSVQKKINALGIKKKKKRKK